MVLDKNTVQALLVFQRNEVTEHRIYAELSRLEKDASNREVLKKISADELRHYQEWKSHTGREIAPDHLKIFWYTLLSRLFGITFTIKLMEEGEAGAQEVYDRIVKLIPEAESIRNDESRHENELIGMLNEERLNYLGSVVLGLNDALVELTGTLAGLTFALQNAKLVGVAGLITGIAASLSMAASEYISTKTEGGHKNPVRASIYTGITYVGAVTVLIVPFLLLPNPYLALGLALVSGIILIMIFTFYFSVVRGVSFRRRFLEMAAVSLSVAALSFLIGLLVRQFLGIEI
jgi:VIT1/CCC1 family predicted Fe2+/Mn2+ transporter